MSSVNIVRVCIVYPWITILLFTLVGLGSAIYAARNFSINTDISNLIAPDIDWRQREIALDKAFPSRVQTILAVVDAPTPELASLGADALTARLKTQSALFHSVRRPDGGEFFETNALLFLPVETPRRNAGATAGRDALHLDACPRPELAGPVAGERLPRSAGSRRKQYGLDALAPIFDRFSNTLDDIAADRPASFSWQELLTGQKVGAERTSPICRYLAGAGLQRARTRPSGNGRGAQGGCRCQPEIRLSGAPSPDRIGSDRRRGIRHRQGGRADQRHRNGRDRAPDPVARAEVRAHHRCRFHRADHRPCDHGGARIPDGRLAQPDFGRVLCAVRRPRRRFLHPVQRALSRRTLSQGQRSTRR